VANSWIEKRKAAMLARCKFVRARVELQPRAPRIPSAGPTSAAVKVVPPDLRRLIDASLAARRSC
jgi:hypothetical protein